MSVSSIQVPVVPLLTATIWPLFGPAEFGPVGRARAVQAEVLDPGADEADVVGVDLGRVVAVIPGEPVV